MSKFVCSNDLCINKGQEIEIPNYKMSVVGNAVIYKDSFGTPITCEYCHTMLTNIPKNEPGGYTCGLSLFGSKSNKEKKAILKKRAQQHMKTCAEDREYGDHQDII